MGVKIQISAKDTTKDVKFAGKINIWINYLGLISSPIMAVNSIPYFIFLPYKLYIQSDEQCLKIKFSYK